MVLGSLTLLKLTTDRHEASRGLFTTAELLVLPLDAFECRHSVCYGY